MFSLPQVVWRGALSTIIGEGVDVPTLSLRKSINASIKRFNAYSLPINTRGLATEGVVKAAISKEA